MYPICEILHLGGFGDRDRSLNVHRLVMRFMGVCWRSLHVQILVYET